MVFLSPPGLKLVATFMAIATYVLALSVFVFIGAVTGLLFESEFPASNWNAWIGGAMGLALALAFTIEGYLKRNYTGFSQFQWISILWAALGAVLFGIYTLAGKNEPGENAFTKLLYSMVASLAFRVALKLHEVSERRN